ncbi:TIGR02302 family protein [Microvirga flavescens]|uniref:TIGR02302 family protein n=1 Tax=Microvirga flavescens TaxID=2249811 RepID=UPI000DD5C028|nr:TIGR02302 family protein [Microvirga flavescens]
MTEGPGPIPEQGHLQERLEGLVLRARLALWWEKAWPALWLPLAVIGVFLTVSWLGLWFEVTPLVRMLGVGLFGLALLASFWRLLRLHRARRAEALDRLDRDSGLPHGPARALDDHLATGTDDPGTAALWELHRKRAAAALDRLRVAAPRPDMPRRDRLALRAAGLLTVAASAFVAGPEIGERLKAAFDWRAPSPRSTAFRVDGWIDPPLYTRLPPLMIDLSQGEQRLRAPVRSTIVIRIAGDGEATVKPERGLTPLPETATRRQDLREQRFTLDGGAELSVKTGFSHAMRLIVEAVPDSPPEIAFTGQPEVNARGTFTLAYKGKDDYGISSIEGLVEKADIKGRSLVPAPQITLSLPAPDGTETRSVVDLTEHPWAGARVKLKLRVKDDAGQEATSEAIEFRLPQRAFSNPLAKALVEQRSLLVLAPDDRRRVQTALDTLLIAPDVYTPQWGVFIGLRTAAQRLRRARTDAELIDIADWLWTMAVQIEDGNLSEAERDLRAAQDQLREAIERGAPDEEINRLTQQLRQAMDKFLREFAQRLQQQDPKAQQNQRVPDRIITQNDLNRMLRQMQEAMRRGDMAEAQRLLDQLRNILENLQMVRPDSRMTDPLGREMNQAMRNLEDMAREQQQLRDDTFQGGQNRRMRQGERNRQQQGQENEDGDPMQGFSQRQQALRDRLQDLQNRMRGLGMEPEDGLGDAEQAMRDAESAMGQGQDGEAVEAQGRALEGLRRGMQGMAQQMQPGQGNDQGNDQAGDQGEDGNGNPSGRRSGGQADNLDPLARPWRERGESPDGRPIPGLGRGGNAARILDELRRKLGDPNRPQEELNYFERLLRRN